MGTLVYVNTSEEQTGFSSFIGMPKGSKNYAHCREWEYSP